ncbi:MAG: hypothetical protein D6796_05025 [Caldilineae bacterium]|nr:MAG: hypothetical protein D6796_05025 [Caldilineae bacterium]
MHQFIQLDVYYPFFAPVVKLVIARICTIMPLASLLFRLCTLAKVFLCFLAGTLLGGLKTGLF